MLAKRNTLMHSFTGLDALIFGEMNRVQLLFWRRVCSHLVYFFCLKSSPIIVTTQNFALEYLSIIYEEIE